MSATVAALERRVCPRYRYEGEVWFEQEAGDGARRTGHGVTADISRRCVRFCSEERLEPGTELTLRVSWPEMLQRVCSLELLVRGVVTEVNSRGTLVSIGSYEFRTCGARSFWEAPEASSNWLLA